MAEKKEVAQKQEFTTNLSEWTNLVTGLVSRDFELCGVQYDEYSKQCAMNAMSAIFQLVQNTDKADMKSLNTSNLREVVAQCASLKLNASSMPREVYFQLRSKQINGQWIKLVEIGIEGDGNDALLRNFGVNVDAVYPSWLVKEGDDFIYPKYKGLEITPPEWNPKGLSEKTVRVVTPIKLKDGTIEYRIAEREAVKNNLLAHISNNMTNETFGFVTGKNSKGKDRTRYDATAEEKAKISAKKEEILSAVRKCETLEDILNSEVARPFTWLQIGDAGAEVKDVQNKLIAIGYSLPSGADGKYGNETYTAVKKFQHDVNIKEDGLAGEVTRAKLNNAYNTRSAAKANNSWVARLQAACNAQGFSNQRVDGIAGPNTLVGCPTLGTASKGSITKLAQERLNALGYNCGSADGKNGPKTQKGIKAFQKAKGLPANGIVDRKTWKALLGL